MKLELLDFTLNAISENSKVASFDCDQADITDFLREDALNYQNQLLASTYIFTDLKENIWAYFSVSNDCVKSTGEENGFDNFVWNRLHRTIKIPNSKRMRNYPSIKVGRLGVHKGLHGTGLAYQLMDFIKRWVPVDHKPACRLLTLDAVNQFKQIKYYNRNEFEFLLETDENSKTRVMYYDLLKLKHRS
ncbi:hypothetical protein SAMN06265348_110136 [Pedobacter westerhofensis]|uniref:Acetyltransferase (GNAT) domain-containing protein n=1 Tax=Pedobacter westerhofensis TaxID=425512 RepID=A0A521F4M0_9SPHI|nr:GNAT family N-acetyltransferase [Pedobacter westerhofensis]SMO91157.1 hypothetical protein SAMN06265348_110136 [Pedobacter westerhofensis]